MYRSILRNIARNNMKRLGADRLNKPRPGNKSKFAAHWREFVK